MPKPSAQLNVTFHDVSDETEVRVEEIISDTGFHVGFKEGSYLNFQPFEQNEQNESLVQEAVDELRSEVPEVEVSITEGVNGDAGSLVAYDYNISVSTGSEQKSNPNEETKRGLDEWRSSPDFERNDDLDWKSAKENRVATPDHDEGENHTIHSFGDISHEIRYKLDDKSEELVFDSMEPTDVGGASLDTALQVEQVHCTCGEQNMTREEATEHLRKHL